jgi:hypothetical protein
VTPFTNLPLSFVKLHSEAFAAQAAADLDAYSLLAESALPSAHRLHYLQMWLEKLCKAHLWLVDTHSEDLRWRHNVVAKVLPQLIREHWRRIGLENRPAIATIRDLCREIDLLHPQVDDNGRRPDNVEYPWVGTGGDIEVPAKWTFPLAQRLYTNPGRLLLKAANRLTRSPNIFIPRAP